MIDATGTSPTRRRFPFKPVCMFATELRMAGTAAPMWSAAGHRTCTREITINASGVLVTQRFPHLNTARLLPRAGELI